MQGQSFILAGALISIALNPLVFASVTPLQRWLRERSSLARSLEKPVDPLAELPMATDSKYLSGQAVLVGYGQVGRRIGADLQARGIAFVVAEQNREVVDGLRKRGMAAVSGDAAEPSVLIQAHVARADMLIITTPDSFAARQMIKTARTLNPNIALTVRAFNEDEAALLEQEAPGCVFLEQAELARGMSRHVLARYAPLPGTMPAAG